MHMNMRHGLASSRPDIHADVKTVRLVLGSQPRLHSEEQFLTGAANSAVRRARRTLKRVAEGLRACARGKREKRLQTLRPTRSRPAHAPAPDRQTRIQDSLSRS